MMEIVHSNGNYLVQGAYIALFAAAAGFDIATYRIPNSIAIALVIAFPIGVLFSGGEVQWLSHLGAAMLIFVAGAVLFRFGLLGGGDVKLLAAGALWVGLSQLHLYLLLVSIVGGLLAASLLLFRRVVQISREGSRSGRRVNVPRLFRRGEKLPYGVAIAGGSILMTLEFPLFFEPALSIH